MAEPKDSQRKGETGANEASSAERPTPAAQPPRASASSPTQKAAKPPASGGPPTMQTEPWGDDLTELLRRHFGNRILEFASYRGQKFLIAQPEAVVPIIEFLKLEAQFDYLVDITAVDYPQRPERFDLVYILYSFARNERIRIKTRIPEGYKPESAVRVHPTANWLEREVYDMFGIEFANHPDLRRILLPEDWQGHPLRKDTDILAMDNEWVRRHLGIESGQ